MFITPSPIFSHSSSLLALLGKDRGTITVYNRVLPCEDPTPLESVEPTLQTGSGLETGQGNVTLFGHQTSDFWSLILFFFLLCRQSIYFPMAKHNVLLAIFIVLCGLNSLESHLILSVLRGIMISWHLVLRSISWPLLHWIPIIPTAISEPMSTTVSSTFSSGPQKRANTGLHGDADVLLTSEFLTA